ncbi:MAG: imidazole glycerol phosphate synthase subunit HisH [Lachnospiraceae bacterium]|nr:imidazole glycerol phosphate synthase subunit HisH [Lachnospiraceae bacterium]MCI9390486.1 imidazole glycerol phosphate synthase subunit HisH [Lachnospiraceae bacterium]MCI9470735.1 imidazole glycerol phosphate synthase subunit HisH [Lachnospiraceae bacterium]
MITMIDYDAGNMKSVEKALLHLGEEVQVTRRAEDILCADKVILPGVGNFGSAMGKLDEYGLTDVIRQVCEKGTPFLGICLGLQLLFEESAESPGVKGLGILPGKICRIPKASGLKIPHMGWNALHLPRTGRLFAGVPEGAYVYFVHSFYLQAADERMVAAETDYGVGIHASVEWGNVFACQFHPEKSGDLGLTILQNFAGLDKGTEGVG